MMSKNSYFSVFSALAFCAASAFAQSSQSQAASSQSGGARSSAVGPGGFVPQLASVPAGDGAESKMIDEVKKRMRKVDGMKRIPGTGMSLVEAGDMTVLVSDNGRFVVGKFQMVDMWNSSLVTKIADLDQVDKVDLKKLNANPEDLGALVFGNGPQEVVMFIDPNCPHCHKLMSQMPALSSQYTFKMVMIPVLGPASGELSKKLLCATDKTLAARALIENVPEGVRLSSTKCDVSPLTKAVMIARLLSIDAVPYTITPKHNVLRGEVPDLAAALKNN